MSMTRKHYVEFAKIIADRLDAVAGFSDRAVVEHEIDALATDLARMFKRDNPHFDISRFRSAAGLDRYPERNTPNNI